MMRSSPKSYQRGQGNVRVANCIILYRLFSLSRQKKQIGNCPVEEAKKMRCYKRLIFKQFVKVSCLNCGPQFLSYLPICRNISCTFVELCMEMPYWCAVLVHQYGRQKLTKTSGVHVFCKSSFFSLENQHTLYLLKITRREFFSTRQHSYFGVTHCENLEVQIAVFSK